MKRQVWVLAAILVLLLRAAPAGAATGWSGSNLIDPAAHCHDVAVAIDASGRPHVAAECGGRIHYSVETAGSWSTTILPRPIDRVDRFPAIAIDGTTLYVVFDRAVDGVDGVDSVYYRTRTLPRGSWSTPKRLGRTGDVLQSFRVVHKTLHATVVSASGEAIYETNAGGTLKRYALPGALGPSSLRVGSDGHARIAYTTGKVVPGNEIPDYGPIRYATFTGSGFRWSTIPGTSGDDHGLALVLDARNRAYLVWEHTPGFDELTPNDGTMYATNASGSWTAPAARRITSNVGSASITLDVLTGRVHVLLGSPTGVRYYTKSATGRWSGLTVALAEWSNVAIRLSPATGRLVAIFASPGGNATGVYALTNP
jgi:hypothetical protein